MIKGIKIYGLVILLLLGTRANGQSEAKNSFKRQIETINNQISKAYKDQDEKIIVSFFGVDATCMPEYHKALYRKEDISKYFQRWFASTKSNTYSRNIVEVQNTQDYIIETGTFTNEFVNTNNISFVYKGKYIRFWKIEKNNKLTIISDIWGADDYLDRTKFPVIENIGTDVLPAYLAKTKIENEIGKRNQYITALVVARNGEAHSWIFAKDAVYMPYYKPMLIGFDNVKAYFIEHEKAGDVNIDSLQIKTSKVIEIGNVVFEQGYYGVKWRAIDNTSQGVVTGKSINIWKRDRKGTLMLYRQMVNHD
jgi:ketosteroid isomerase-like protein